MFNIKGKNVNISRKYCRHYEPKKDVLVLKFYPLLRSVCFPVVLTWVCKVCFLLAHFQVKGVYCFQVKGGPGGAENKWIVDAKNGSGSVALNGNSKSSYCYLHFVVYICHDLERDNERTVCVGHTLHNQTDKWYCTILNTKIHWFF